MPSNISSNANNTVEKGSPQLPILFVVQKSDHVGQENVIGLLTTKEYTELCDSIFKECLLNNIFWLTQKCHEFPLNQLMKHCYCSHKILFTFFLKRISFNHRNILQINKAFQAFYAADC